MPNATWRLRLIKRRVALGEENFSKRKEFLRGKLDRNQKKRTIKTNAMECLPVWTTDMGYQIRRYKKTGGLSDVNIMKKNGKNQLD